MLANLGCTPLLVTGLEADAPVFTTDASLPFSVAAGSSRSIGVTFLPSTTGAVTGTMTLTTDSAARPVMSLPLSGTGQPAGSAEFPTTAVNLIVQPEQERTTTVRVRNTGEGVLIWNVAVASADKEAVPATVKAAQAVPDSAADGDPGAVPLGSGGPDTAGYRWLDSDAPGGPVFSWIEIAYTGTAALTWGTDVMTSLLPIGFPVYMYGQSSSTFQVNSDGWICLVNSGFSTVGNYAIPSQSLGACGIAAFWDDLDLSAMGSGTSGTTSWTAIWSWSGTGSCAVTRRRR